MSAVSLKERLKELQALKSSVQVKSQAALARQKELTDAPGKSPIDAEASNLEDNGAQSAVDLKDIGTRSPASPDGKAHDEPDAPSKNDVNEEHKASPGGELHNIPRVHGMASKDEMKDKYKDDDVEIILEEVVVEGDKEGVEIIETEELVVVADFNEYEKTIETEATERMQTPPNPLGMSEMAATYNQSPPRAALDTEEEPTQNRPQHGGVRGVTAQRRESAGLPHGFYSKENRRWRCIVAFLILIGLCAVVALVLPFVLDYDKLGDDPTRAVVISPAPTAETSTSPTMVPTISPAPTAIPTQSPSIAPTTSAVPSVSTTMPPTKSPTLAPSPPPTGSPILLTPAPVTPTSAPTDRPVAPTVSPISSPLTASPTTLRLDNFIQVFCVPISGVEAFEDQATPQFQAAKFVAEDDTYAAEVVDEVLLKERYALVTFYFATVGNDWERCNVEDTSCANRWLVEDVCSWESVSCNSAGRVVSLIFDGLVPVGLSGFLPPEIYVLGALEDLTIIDENIGGSLPTRFGTNATTIRQLVIQGTQLGGSIPFAYLENSPIESLLLNSNRIGGTIPFEIGSIPTLEELDLSGNQLMGTVPGGLVRYSSLATLAVDSNLLQGSIPTGIYAMSNLQRLHVNDNGQMVGSLDPAIGAMNSLQGLRVGNTGIGGTLPDELFTLGNLIELDLRNAAFFGSLSPAFSNLGSTLQQLYLQDNAFTGTVPEAFGALTGLTALALEGNNLKGSIVSEVCVLLAGALDELSVDCEEVQCSCCTECFR